MFSHVEVASDCASGITSNTSSSSDSEKGIKVVLKRRRDCVCDGGDLPGASQYELGDQRSEYAKKQDEERMRLETNQLLVRCCDCEKLAQPSRPSSCTELSEAYSRKKRAEYTQRGEALKSD